MWVKSQSCPNSLLRFAFEETGVEVMESPLELEQALRGDVTRSLAVAGTPFVTDEKFSS